MDMATDTAPMANTGVGITTTDRQHGPPIYHKPSLSQVGLFFVNHPIGKGSDIFAGIGQPTAHLLMVTHSHPWILSKGDRI